MHWLESGKREESREVNERKKEAWKKEKTERIELKRNAEKGREEERKKEWKEERADFRMLLSLG
jgi:hypothetical protein